MDPDPGPPLTIPSPSEACLHGPTDLPQFLRNLKGALSDDVLMREDFWSDESLCRLFGLGGAARAPNSNGLSVRAKFFGFHFKPDGRDAQVVVYFNGYVDLPHRKEAGFSVVMDPSERAFELIAKEFGWNYQYVSLRSSAELHTYRHETWTREFEYVYHFYDARTSAVVSFNLWNDGSIKRIGVRVQQRQPNELNGEKGR